MSLHINDIKWWWLVIQTTVMECIQKCGPTGWT